MESRGNRNLVQNGQNIGSELSSSTLHFGPFWPLNAYEHAHFEKRSPAGQGFDQDFHTYQFEWTTGNIYFRNFINEAMQKKENIKNE